MTTTKKAGPAPKVNTLYFNFNYYDGLIEDIEANSKADGQYDYSIEVILPLNNKRNGKANIIGSVKAV
jgi:hypothetical protein